MGDQGCVREEVEERPWKGIILLPQDKAAKAGAQETEDVGRCVKEIDMEENCDTHEQKIRL